MKKLCLLIMLCSLSFYLKAQLNLSSEKWQEDLNFLQETVHKDYNFLFKKTTPEKFNAEVEKLRLAIPGLSEHEIIIGMAKIVSLFEYGHTSLPVTYWWSLGPLSFHQMAYNLIHFKDGIFIQGTHKQYKNALGAKVLKIEGKDIQEVLDAVKPVFPTENDEFFEAYGMLLLGNAEVLHAQKVTPTLQTEITLTLEKDGNVFDQSFSPVTPDNFPKRNYTYIIEDDNWLDARDNSTDPLYLKHMDRIYFYEYLPEYKTVYIRHSQIQDEENDPIPAFYERVFKFIEENEVEKLVLDVRLNGGGNNYKNKAIVTNIIKSKINKAGSLFVIIGGQTFSACQNLVNELDNYTEAIFIGEPTGENINFYGDNRRVLLPNSQIPVRLSFAWWQDKPQWENADWLAPHIAIEMSFEEYASNQDPVLDKALTFSDDQFILDPMSYFSDLYLSGQSEKLQSEAIRMVNDPDYKFFDFEGEFNRKAYEILNQGDVHTAISVFQLITGLFPESPNAWDSLAEGHWKAGNLIKAKEFYNKAIHMDPEGPTGENARNMLKKIRAEE